MIGKARESREKSNSTGKSVKEADFEGGGGGGEEVARDEEDPCEEE